MRSMENGSRNRCKVRALAPARWIALVAVAVLGLIHGKNAFAQFAPAANLDSQRERHAAVALSDGRVLVGGGYDSSRNLPAATSLYDVASGWVATGPLPEGALDLTFTLLQDGRVIAVGGYATGHTIAALYTPGPGGSGTWASAATLLSDGQVQARGGHAATLLPDGRVLVVGGSDVGGFRFHTSELYTPDASAGSWALAAAPAATERANVTATLLRDGTVLVVGGSDNNGNHLASTEAYVPSPMAAGSWLAKGSLSVGRDAHTATLLPDGTVLVAGGVGQTVLSSAELYNPLTGLWSTTGSMATARYQHTATLLPCGLVLVTGGAGAGSAVIGSGELYNPATRTWSPAGNLTSARLFHTATATSNGNVLLTGGDGGPVYSGSALKALNSAELYMPASCLLKPCVGFGAGTVADPFSGFVGNGVSLSISNPGPSGAGSDAYLRTLDESGTSYVTAPILNGSYTGQGSICFDVRLFEDGNGAAHDPHPVRLNLFAPSGVTAAFVGPLITEDGGSSPGWHHVCAPLGPLLGTQLPRNGDGFWVVANADGSTASPSAWPAILASVTEFRLSAFDFQTIQTEAAGYDNVCVSVAGAAAPAVPALSGSAFPLLGVALLVLGSLVVRRMRRVPMV